MFQDKKVYTTQWAGKTLTVELGEMARQANAAVVVKYGDTVVLTTAVASKEAKDVDFFPLTVNYEEKMYAVGKIPGGFLRREGRPGTEATLAARLIDRPIRPLFEDGFRNEVQVISTVLSVEQSSQISTSLIFFVWLSSESNCSKIFFSPLYVAITTDVLSCSYIKFHSL